MSQDHPQKNDEQKNTSVKGNQITTHNQEPTTWIEIPENEFPEGITNQNILQIIEYRQIVNSNHCNDITIVEENTIKETKTGSGSTQTDSVIVKHKYSSEKIKPYFLTYFELDNKRSIESLGSANPFGNIIKEPDWSIKSSVSKIDKATSVSTTASTFITDYLQTLAVKSLVNKQEQTRANPDNTKNISIYPLPNNILQPPETTLSTDVKTVIIFDKNSAGYLANSFTERVKNILLQEIINKSKCAAMSDFHQNRAGLKCPPPEDCCGPSGSKINVCKPNDDNVNIMCKKGDVKFKLKCRKIEGNTQDCNKVGNEIRYECEIIPEDDQCIDRKILESCDLKCRLITATHSPIHAHELAHLDVDSDVPPTKPNPPPKKESSFKDTPKISLTIKTSNPHTENCLVVEEKSQAIPSEPLDINENEDKTQTKVKTLDKCLNDENKDNIEVIDKSSITGIKTEGKSGPVKALEECVEEKKIFACRSKTKKYDDSRPDEHPPLKCEIIIKPPCPPDCSLPCPYKDGKPPPPPEYKRPKCSPPLPPCTEKSGTLVLEEMKANLIKGHNKTMATLKIAADDILVQIPKAVEKTKTLYSDPCALNAAVHSAEEFVCEMHKKVNESGTMAVAQQSVECLVENGKKNLTKLQECSRSVVRGATNMGKALLGYKVKTEEEEDDERCERPALPCRPKTKKVSNDIDSELNQAVIESLETFYDTVLTTAKQTRSSLTDFTQQSVKAFDINNKTSSKESLKSKSSSTKSSKERSKEIQETTSESNLKVLKKSAENLFETVAKATNNIMACTGAACSEIANQSKKLLSLDSEHSIERKKNNIKKVLSGFKLFQEKPKEPTPPPSPSPSSSPLSPPAKTEPVVPAGIMHTISSTFTSLQESIVSYGERRSFEKSSPYDKPTSPPKDVAFESTGKVSGIFSTLKEKIYSYFNGTGEAESVSSQSSIAGGTDEAQEEIDEQQKKNYLFDTFFD